MTSAVLLVSNQVVLKIERFPALATCCCVLSLVVHLHVPAHTTLV